MYQYYLLTSSTGPLVCWTTRQSILWPCTYSDCLLLRHLVWASLCRLPVHLQSSWQDWYTTIESTSINKCGRRKRNISHSKDLGGASRTKASCSKWWISTSKLNSGQINSSTRDTTTSRCQKITFDEYRGLTEWEGNN